MRNPSVVHVCAHAAMHMLHALAHAWVAVSASLPKTARVYLDPSAFLIKNLLIAGDIIRALLQDSVAPEPSPAVYPLILFLPFY